MRNPPILISVLGFFAVMAGFVWIVVGLRGLGVEFGSILGDLPAYDNVGIWGIVSLGVGIAWILAGLGPGRSSPGPGCLPRSSRSSPW